MAGELSGILEHVDRIGSSTSRGSSRPRTWSSWRTCCAPTSRARAWPREVALAPAPEPVDGAFRVPSPQADA